VTWNDVRRLALGLPKVVEGTSYGTAAFHVGKKFLLRLKEDGATIALKISFDDRDYLLQAKPQTYFITDHYRNYPAVLVRLSKIREREMRDVLKRAWDFVTRKR